MKRLHPNRTALVVDSGVLETSVETPLLEEGAMESQIEVLSIAIVHV